MEKRRKNNFRNAIICVNNLNFKLTSAGNAGLWKKMYMQNKPGIAWNYIEYFCGA